MCRVRSSLFVCLFDCFFSESLLYRQDLVAFLQSSIHRCLSVLFYFGHKYAVVIHNIRLVHTSNYVEAQA